MPRRSDLTDNERKALALAVRAEMKRRGWGQQDVADRVNALFPGANRHQTSVGTLLSAGSYAEKFAREVCEALDLPFEATVGRQLPTARGRIAELRAKGDPRVERAIEAFVRKKKRRPEDWVIQIANMHAERESRTDQEYWDAYVEDTAWMFASTDRRLLS